MLQTDELDVESAILQELDQVGICTLGELINGLPSYSVNQICSALDGLNRAGTIMLKQSVKFRYLVARRANARYITNRSPKSAATTSR
jgi:hypothetical protein